MKKKLRCILFDCDGVLIDVTSSYREVIKQTVQEYVVNCLKISDSTRPLVTNKDIEVFKAAGGFNNDWELTYALLEMFLAYVPPVKIVPIKLHNIPRILKFLNFIGPQLRITGNKLLAQKNIASYLKNRSAEDKHPAAASVLLFNQGELYETNLVKRIFQEYYLGGENFTQIYHRRPLIYEGEGYLEREKSYFKREELASLAQKYTLGVVTGRPRVEVELGLKQFDIRELFSVVVAAEDVEEEEKKHLREAGQVVKLGKPHPFSLLTAVSRLGLADNEEAIYVGDVGDDIKAATAAKNVHPFIAIGVLQASSNPEAAAQIFKEAGADYVLSHVSKLTEIL